ncbi:MAG: hypothetical protein ACRDTG_13370 [Pseudonocardiaceae bacterium]
MDDEDYHTREVYAHFGLAVHRAQVLDSTHTKTAKGELVIIVLAHHEPPYVWNVSVDTLSRTGTGSVQACLGEGFPGVVVEIASGGEGAVRADPGLEIPHGGDRARGP